MTDARPQTTAEEFRAEAKRVYGEALCEEKKLLKPHGPFYCGKAFHEGIVATLKEQAQQLLDAAAITAERDALRERVTRLQAEIEFFANGKIDAMTLLIRRAESAEAALAEFKRDAAVSDLTRAAWVREDELKRRIKELEERIEHHDRRGGDE